MSVPSVYVNGTIILVLGGKLVTIRPNHPNYELVRKSVSKATEAELLKLVKEPTTTQ